MCGKENETINHPFLHCEVAVQVWNDFIRRCDIAWCCPKNIAKAANAWRSGCFIGCGRLLWRIISFVILWSIRKERNERIFRGSSASVADLIYKVAF